MSRRHGPLRVPVLSLNTFAAMAFAAILIVGGSSARAERAPVTIGGPFTLTAPDGSAVTEASYRGKWLIVFFGYTFCPDLCPTTLMDVAGAIEKLGDAAERVQPLFITVDPERDTPEVMGRYAESFHPRIVGLTGSPRQIAEVAEAYGAYGARHETSAREGTYLVDHSTTLYIMNPQGKFVRGLDFDTPAERIAETLRGLMTRSDR